MMKRSLLIVALLASLGRVALAVPPPMTDEELLNNADLAIDGEGLSIVCDGPAIDNGGSVVSTYLSTVHPTKSYKGGLPNSVTIRGRVTVWTPGPGPVGGWEPNPIREGWIGKMYLKNNNDGTYSKLWWNAFEEATASAPKPLPTCTVGDAGPDSIAPTDAAPADATQPDVTPEPDTAQPDAIQPDSAEEDAAPSTDSQADAAIPEESSDSSGCSCQATAGGPGWLLMFVGLVLLRRLRRPA